MGLKIFLLVLAFTQSGTGLTDYSTSVKLKACGIRFSGRHKAFLWAWLDKYDDEDVRIAMQLISHWESPALLLELEAIILRATELPDNVQIPTEM